VNILISGAGPAAAFWLQRYGFATTVVERAPALRGDGFAVDFRGTAHIDVLTRMGILDDVRAIQTNMGAQTAISSTGKPSTPPGCVRWLSATSPSSVASTPTTWPGSRLRTIQSRQHRADVHEPGKAGIQQNDDKSSEQHRPAALP
jgi:2-polyprenyl-6-methoxyphenol hydroxylase-like FAD-dependent oxidoreductase